MDTLKAASLASTERETRMLQETRQSLAAELEASRKREAALTWELQQLQKEHAALTADKMAEGSELRAELRIKGFELTSLGVSFEVQRSASSLFVADFIFCMLKGANEYPQTDGSGVGDDQRGAGRAQVSSE